MKCIKCGKELNEIDKFCTDCGQKVEKETQSQTNNTQTKVEEVVKKEEVKEEKRIISSMQNDTFLCIISMICFLGGPIISLVIEVISSKIPFMGLLNRVTGLLPLFGFGLAIYTKVKYPKSRFAKVLIIIYIILFVIAVILFVLFLVACFNAAESCGEGFNSIDFKACAEMGLIIH